MKENHIKMFEEYSNMNEEENQNGLLTSDDEKSKKDFDDIGRTMVTKFNKDFRNMFDKVPESINEIEAIVSFGHHCNLWNLTSKAQINVIIDELLKLNKKYGK